jgi:hypothetical protein
MPLLSLHRLRAGFRHLSNAVMGRWFSAVMLACSAAALWLLSAGLRELREPVERIANNRAHDVAASPLAYRDSVPGLRGLTGTGGWRFVVRVDSVPSAEEPRLCETVAALQRVATVAWLDLSGSVPACVGGGESPAGAAEAEGLRHELHGARWALVDEHDRAVYSARTVPAAAELLALGELYRVAPGGGR